MTSPRFLAAIFALGAAISSCTVLFDYGEDAGSGGGSSQGGGGAAPSCNVSADCDDANDCTTDTCVVGSCDHSAVADGLECQNGGGQDGICDAGACVVSCTADDPTVCDDANECTVDSCDTDIGQCVNTPEPDGPIAQQTAGDCKVVVCDGGIVVTEIDPSDPFDDGNDCTDDVCRGGLPINLPLPAGASCGTSLVCDGAGTCQGCNTAADCAGSDTFCQTITCEGGSCGVSYTAAGTPLPAQNQTAGPCKEIQCDGSGGQQTVNRPAGTACDDGQFCNGGDSCLSGNCSQHTGDPCPGADGDGDCSESCNESTDACTANDANGTACNDGLFCNGADTCLNGACSQHAGDPCPGPDGDSDCSETCNESADACTGNDPNGTSCNDGLFCNGTDTCQNGTCSHSGNPCAAHVGDGDGDCSEDCNESTDSCTANDPVGSACDDGVFCNGPDSCNGSGSCTQHAGDPCLPVFGGSCFSSCNETQNNCTALDPNQTPCGMNGCCSSSGDCGICL